MGVMRPESMMAGVREFNKSTKSAVAMATQFRQCINDQVDAVQKRLKDLTQQHEFTVVGFFGLRAVQQKPPQTIKDVPTREFQERIMSCIRASADENMAPSEFGSQVSTMSAFSTLLSQLRPV